MTLNYNPRKCAIAGAIFTAINTIALVAVKKIVSQAQAAEAQKGGVVNE